MKNNAVTDVSTPASVASPYSEAATWRPLGKGWSQLHGSFRDHGLSFEWHDFTSKHRFEWGESFHPDSLELCLNLAGEGYVQHGGADAAFRGQTFGYYCRAVEPLRAWRQSGQRHQFLTVEFSFEFLRAQLAPFASSLSPLVRAVVSGDGVRSAVGPVANLTARQQLLLQSLREPPVLAAAQPLWYRTKALELATECFFMAPDGREMFCQRQKRLASDRVQKVIAILQRDLSAPPPLEELGRAVGCSAFHLSRTFSAEAGMTIQQYLRKLRLERAAELLKSGRHNVTEVALEVGYSISHFSTAFHEMYGCCPGLYPLKTQRGQMSTRQTSEPTPGETRK